MEKRSAIVLRHKNNGLYFDRMAEHTPKLWAAWRFHDEQYLHVWLETSIYAPKNADEYEIVSVNLTIEEVESIER